MILITQHMLQPHLMQVQDYATACSMRYIYMNDLESNMFTGYI